MFHRNSKRTPRAALLSLLAAVTLPAAAADHDYPTYERVQYVLQCMVSHGGAQALIYQCSCAIDKLAEQFSVDDFVELQTAANAIAITGERGGELRDNADVRNSAKRYRQAEQAALQSCGVKSR
jgi:hypothetical protein